MAPAVTETLGKDRNIVGQLVRRVRGIGRGQPQFLARRTPRAVDVRHIRGAYVREVPPSTHALSLLDVDEVLDPDELRSLRTDLKALSQQRHEPDLPSPSS